MRKALAIILIMALTLVVVPAVMASPGLVVLSTVDIDTVGGAVVCTGDGSCRSFNPERLGNWGGENGGGAVTAHPNDPDDAGYVSLDTPKGAAKAISIRHLDGLADDSFDVLVEDVHGAWITVGHYTDVHATETWVKSTFALPDTMDLARGRAIEVKIALTGAKWSGFATWGQLAIDKVELLGRGPAK